MAQTAATTVKRTVCSLDCPDSCGVLVTVDTATGRAIKVAGDPEHPVTRGFLCGKVAKYLDRVYAPDRVLYPMRRRAGVAKGPLAPDRQLEAFERVSWDVALDAIAKRLRGVVEAYGSEAVLPYSYAGTIGVLGYGSMDRRFFHRLGASQLDRTICATAGGEALMSVYGRKLGTDTEQFHRARLILAWGANIHSNNIHLWPQIEDARRAGARLVVIDPYATRTARLADQHLQLHPGTDTALALGLMHVILRDGLEDAAWTAAHTHGLASLRTHVLPYTPQFVAGVTGLAASVIEELARSYATTYPAVIRMNYGVQRGENGGAAARAIAMLPALTGAWQHLGGGLQLSTSGAFAFDKQALEMPELMQKSGLGRPARVINMSLLGDALTRLGGTPADEPEVKALFVYNSNPAVIAPDQARVLAGLERVDLFTVVHEQSFTDTCDYADYVLPATTFLEAADVQGAYGHYYVQLSEQAIAPCGEARTNVQLFSELARRMGFTEACFAEDAETLMAQALREGKPDSQDRWMRGMTRATIRARGGSERLHFASEQPGQSSAPYQPFMDGVFSTPSGKVEFYSEYLAQQGLDAMPTYRPAIESRANAEPGMLEFLPRKSGNYMNSTFAELPAHQQLQRETLDRLEMHAEDAAARNIDNGDAVLVRNGRGRLRLTALVSERVRPGVVSAGMGWNKLNAKAGGGGVNQLTSQRLTDLGSGPTFYSTLVWVERAE